MYNMFHQLWIVFCSSEGSWSVFYRQLTYLELNGNTPPQPCAPTDVSDKFFLNLAIGTLTVCDGPNLSVVTKKKIKDLKILSIYFFLKLLFL